MVKLAEFIGKVMTAISIVLMIVLSIPIIYEAIMRAFGHPTIWVFETTLYLFIFLGLLGNALAVRTGAHFRVTLIRELLPQWRRAFDLIAGIMTLAFAVLIMASGSYYIWYSWTNDILSASLLETPMWIPQLAIPLGGLGLFLQTLVSLLTGETAHAEYVAGD
ncbi:MAG: TRAP transporter small permease subunit [Gammaproteobacteria bacterium]|nr:TRAP transporter small permease subunit [Gammaproteobacteria bacterium]